MQSKISSQQFDISWKHLFINSTMLMFRFNVPAQIVLRSKCFSTSGTLQIRFAPFYRFLASFIDILFSFRAPLFMQVHNVPGQVA